MKEIRTKVGEGGRLVIPAAYRKALGLKPGDKVILVLEEGELRVVTARQAIERAQSVVRKYISEGRSLSQELIGERRKEAAGG